MEIVAARPASHDVRADEAGAARDEDIQAIAGILSAIHKSDIRRLPGKDYAAPPPSLYSRGP